MTTACKKELARTPHMVSSSRSIIFLSWCLTHRPVGDCGQQLVRVRRQHVHTEANRVKESRITSYFWRKTCPAKPERWRYCYNVFTDQACERL